MFKNEPSIKIFDSQVWQSIKQEAKRQEDHLELIASENYASPRVLAAQGTILNNKYAEGYPGKRYYGGCEYVDEIENLAIERVKMLFNADFANVQPHSGSQANAAAYAACLNPGDVILGMDLSSGGHLTHGSKVNFSGKMYQAFTYGLNPKTAEIDYEQVANLAREHRPKLIMTGFSAYSRIVDWKRFKEIAQEVGAFLVCDIAHVAGLIAAELYPSPISLADIVTSTTHKTLRGPRAGLIIAKNNPELAKKINSAVFPGLQGGPLCHVIAAKAVAFKEALTPEFKTYQLQVLKNAKAMAKVMIKRKYQIVSGGTDNHLFLINLIDKGITGKDALAVLAKANITANKNSIPNDPQPPAITSGVRIGTPAITTRGFKENEAEQVANWISDLLDNPSDCKQAEKIKREVADLCAKFPVYETQLDQE